MNIGDILTKVKGFVYETEWIRNAYFSLKEIFEPLPWLIVVAGLALMLFFGKKMIGFWKIVGFAGIGFLAGYVFLSPWVIEVLQQDPGHQTLPFIVGGVCALVGVLLFKYLYWLVILGIFGGASFYAAFTLLPTFGLLATEQQATLLYVVSGAIGLVIALLAFALLKWIEMLLTSAVGAFGIAFVTDHKLFNFSALADWGAIEVAVPDVIALSFPISMLVGAGVLFLIGFFLQVKTRRLY